MDCQEDEDFASQPEQLAGANTCMCEVKRKKKEGSRGREEETKETRVMNLPYRKILIAWSV